MEIPLIKYFLYNSQLNNPEFFNKPSNLVYLVNNLNNNLFLDNHKTKQNHKEQDCSIHKRNKANYLDKFKINKYHQSTKQYLKISLNLIFNKILFNNHKLNKIQDLVFLEGKRLNRVQFLDNQLKITCSHTKVKVYSDKIVKFSNKTNRLMSFKISNHLCLETVINLKIIH